MKMNDGKMNKEL